jgi:fructose-1,6-bisphosphatase I
MLEGCDNRHTSKSFVEANFQISELSYSIMNTRAPSTISLAADHSGPKGVVSMSKALDLQTYLDTWAGSEEGRAAVSIVVCRLAEACCRIAAVVRQGALSGTLGGVTGKQSGVDPQKEVDVIANDIVIDMLQASPVAWLASEELETAHHLNTGAPLAVAIDPIDGSSNIDANSSIGTIFTVLPAGREGDDTFLQPGTGQLAAGFAVYGPYTSLVLTVGCGTHIFTLDAQSGSFLHTAGPVAIPTATREYSINASNYRHWDDPIRTYTDDLLQGREGPRGKDFNMRWTASPVADLYRILSRGGIFLYPGDLRDGYALGRLRLAYEANPFAWIMEQAGGAASTGYQRILDITPSALHQRVPVIMGSKSEVDYVVRLHSDPHSLGERSPLFGRRGLFRT